VLNVLLQLVGNFTERVHDLRQVFWRQLALKAVALVAVEDPQDDAARAGGSSRRSGYVLVLSSAKHKLFRLHRFKLPHGLVYPVPKLTTAIHSIRVVLLGQEPVGFFYLVACGVNRHA